MSFSWDGGRVPRPSGQPCRQRHYVHPADPSRDGEDWAGRHAEAAAEMHAAGLPHDVSACGIPHPGTAEYAALKRRRAERPDPQEPAYALARFTESQLLPGYGQASGLRCFMYTTAAVYAVNRDAADAFADANQLRGPQAREYHSELS